MMTRLQYLLLGALLLSGPGMSRSLAAQGDDPIVSAIERKDFATARRLLEPLAARGDASAYFNLGVIALREGDAAARAIRPRYFAEAYGYLYAAAGLGDAESSKELAALERSLSAAEISEGKRQGMQHLARHQDGTAATAVPPRSSAPPAATEMPTDARGATRWLNALRLQRTCAFIVPPDQPGAVPPAGPVGNEESPLLERYLQSCPTNLPDVIVDRFVLAGASVMPMLLRPLNAIFPDSRVLGVAPIVSSSLGVRIPALADSAWKVFLAETDRNAQQRMLGSVAGRFVPPKFAEPLIQLCRSVWGASERRLDEFRRPSTALGGRILVDPDAPATLRCAEVLVELPFGPSSDAMILDWYGAVVRKEYRGGVSSHFRWNASLKRVIKRFGQRTAPLLDHIVDITDDAQRDPELGELIARTHPSYLDTVRKSEDPTRLALLAFFGMPAEPDLMRWLSRCSEQRGVRFADTQRCSVIVRGLANNALITPALVDAVVRAANGQNSQFAGEARRALDAMRARSGG